MYKVLRLRKGNTAQNTAFTGAVGELVYDTQLNQIRIHDGATTGGTVVGIYENATTSSSGLMSSEDKYKLDGIDLSTKQDVISDLDTIRSGAAKGETAIQTHQDISGKQDKSTAVTHTASTAVGSLTQPVYIDSNGIAAECTYTLSKSVPSDAKFTDTVTTVTTSGSGNAVTAISASDGALTVTKETTFLTSHQDISGKCNVSGSRGTLAGYCTSGSATTIDASSPDANETSATSITISAGTSGTSWTKIVRLTSASTVSFSLGSGWVWVGNQAPTYKQNSILVCCWCGSGGLVNLALAS